MSKSGNKEIKKALIQEKKVKKMQKKINKFTYFLENNLSIEKQKQKTIKSVFIFFIIGVFSIGAILIFNYPIFLLSIPYFWTSLIILNKIVEFRRYKNLINSKEAALFYLKAELPKEQQLLYEMKEELHLRNVEIKNFSKLQNKEKKALKELNLNLLRWKYLGRHWEKFYKESQNGILTDEQREEINYIQVNPEKYQKFLMEYNNKLELRKKFGEYL